MPRKAKAEDPLVQQIVDMVGAEPQDRAELRAQVADMRAMQEDLRQAVAAYEAQVKPYVAWMKAGKDHFGVIPRFFGGAQDRVNEAESPIHDVLVAYFKMMTGEEKGGTLRHYTKFPPLASAMPAALSMIDTTNAKYGLKEPDTYVFWDATIATYCASYAYPHTAYRDVGNKPTRSFLMYDYTLNEFVVADPWQWRRDIAQRFDEDLPVDLFVRYFPEKATKQQIKQAKKF